jgi:predicted nucleic acid-binding protein
MEGNPILIDSFAWLEILKGTARGRHALEIIRSSEKRFTSVLNLYELRYRIEQLRDAGTAMEFLTAIQAQCGIVPVDETIALAAGEVKIRHSALGAVDCLLLATATVHHLHLVTGDHHFKGMEGVQEI